MHVHVQVPGVRRRKPQPCGTMALPPPQQRRPLGCSSQRPFTGACLECGQPLSAFPFCSCPSLPLLFPGVPLLSPLFAFPPSFN